MLIICQISLEAKHLIRVGIMKVKGPKNQADFSEALYVVVNALGPLVRKGGAPGCHRTT